MPEIPLQQTLSQAIQHHQAGRLEDAARLYQEVLRQNPRHADALRLLGLIAHSFSKHDTAIELIRQAIAVNPAIAEYHHDLALACHGCGRYEQAVAEYQAALALMPRYAEARYNLGNTLKAQGKYAEAVAAYWEALRINPDYAEVHNNLGNVLNAEGRSREALAEYREAARLQPGNADFHINVANALQVLGEIKGAIAEYEAGLKLRPDDAAGRRHYADALQANGRMEAAIAEYTAAIRLNPNLAAAHNNLGTAYKIVNRLDDAIAEFRAALAIQDDYPEALSNLGSALKDQALMDEAVACFRRAAAIKPDSVELANNLIYAMHFDPASGPREIAAELAKWNERFAVPLAYLIEKHHNDRSPERPLRIGWISADFRRHPIGRFLLPIFAAHDARAFPFYCYSDVVTEDATTAALQLHSQQWRQTHGLSHEQLAALIRSDSIDILIDITMHMRDNRLPVFARKPAPVQMTYLAYCSSTGMQTMDYRLTDTWLETPAASVFTETPLTLDSYWCYTPPPGAPAVNPLPADTTGHVTFGNLNNFCKVSPQAMGAWVEILRAVPKSQLLLHASPGSHQERVRQSFAAAGIEPQRIRFADMLPFEEFMGLFQEIDIALDPFPYAGGTTSCDGLWMGVPLVTLAGEWGVGRGGVSLLTKLGLQELIAPDVGGYVERAVALAHDLPRLRELRRVIRGRMQASRLTDAVQFAEDLQGHFRGAWRKWCAGT